MNADPSDLVADYLAQRADRPLGDTELVSNRALQPFSIAGQEAARNLLDKAVRALEEDEPDRARTFVDRAVQLPFDEHEQSHPVAMVAPLLLFSLVTDTLEDSTDGDRRWLDAAVDVLSAADEVGRYELRDVLTSIDQDYELTRRERASLRSAIAPVPARAELADLRLDGRELADSVLAILSILRAYSTAVDRPIG